MAKSCVMPLCCVGEAANLSAAAVVDDDDVAAADFVVNPFRVF